MFEYENLFQVAGFVFPTLNQLLRFLKSLSMTFGTTLGQHFLMAASASMFYIAIDCKNKTNMKVAEPVT